MLYLAGLAACLAVNATPQITCDPSDPANCSCDGKPIGPHTWTPPNWLVSNKTSVFDTSAPMGGVMTPLSKYQAKATMIVNVASAWGLQNVNYAGLKTLLARYNSSGFQLIAFPSNQFGAQAPCSSECERAYIYHKIGVPFGVFPSFDTAIVNGPGTLETYAVLKGKAVGHDTGFDIAWNYEKFVVDANGVPISRFASDASPMDAEKDIRRVLGLPEQEEDEQYQ